MDSITALLDRVVSDLDLVLSDDRLAGLSDAERVTVMKTAGAAFRRTEAVITETLASAHAVEFPHSLGCRNAHELVQRTVLLDSAGATRVVKATGFVRRELNISSGERLPARWPQLREALLDGVIGIAGLLAATGPVEKVVDRLGASGRLAADICLANEARGHYFAYGVDGGEPVDDDVEDVGDVEDAGGPGVTPEDLGRSADEIVARLDPDGAEPDDDHPSGRRGLTLGPLKEGLRALRGHLLPEVAAQLEAIISAYTNPRVGGPPQPGVRFTSSDDGDEEERARGLDGDAEADDDDDVSPVGEHRWGDSFNSDPRGVIDPRTSSQKRHDALAAALGIAARHEDMPSHGGASPTLVVHVEASDLAREAGAATLPGSFARLPVRVAEQTGCDGTIQRVLFDEGRIIGISTTNRVFTVHQRRAIIARDKECLIPGCHVPASWCEIHHVTEHSQGGATHTDNGVPLCWWHHRSLGRSGWEIRMKNGVPQVRGPGWWDPDRKWRTPRLSRSSSARARPDPVLTVS